jgi:predicted RNA-binding Zn ribbon-like protein
MLPGEPRIVRFIDTVWADRDGPHDDLDTPQKAHLSLTQLGYDVAPLTEDEAAQLRQLRDSLRRLAGHCTKDDRPRAESPLTLEAAVQTVNHHAGRPAGGPTIVVDGGSTLGVAPAAQPKLADLLTQVAREGVDAMTPPTPLPLRACLAPSCVLYYVQDHPRRSWCSPICGNRARAARHYARSKKR